MSEFLAEASVLVRPDTSKFRAELLAQLNAIKIPPIAIPIVAAGVGLATATAATAGLSAAQEAAETTSLGLASAAKVESSALGKQAVILRATTIATEELAVAQTAAASGARAVSASSLGAARASAKLDAALLGLRTAAGSAAVIGLGALALAAIVVGKALRATVVNTAEFEQELNTFRVVAQATDEQMIAVADAAQRLGEDVRLPAVSAADAAIALTELSKAGLSVQDALEGAEGVLQLATAAQISNADAALIAANALNSFGLAGDQATHVADTLANAANAAQGSITDFGLALKQSSAVARQVGLSLEDTTALLSLFAKNGLQGSDAGTSLRVALIRLVAPSKQAAAEIQKLGLQIRDAQGNFRADVFAQFGEATENLSPAARDAAAALIFGQDAIRGVSIGAREGAEGLRIMQFELDQQGTAAELAAARTEGLAGSFQALQNAAQGLSITLGKALAGPVGETASNFAIIAASADKVIRKLSDLGESAEPSGGFLKTISDGATELGKTIFIPGEGLKRLVLLFDSSARAAQEADEKFQSLNSQLQDLQSARVLAAKGGLFGIADALTPQIEGVRDQIKTLERESQGLSAVANPLRDAVVLLERVRDIRIDLDLPVTSINQFIRALEHQAAISEKTEGNINRLRDDFLDLGSKARTGAGGVDALSAALARLSRQAAGAHDELLRLQTEGGTPREQISVLEAAVAAEFASIAKLREGGITAGEPSQIRAIRRQIKSDQDEIKSIQDGIVADQKSAAADAKRAAEDAQKARDEQFQAIADTFGGRAGGIEQAITTAGIRGNLAKEIRLNKSLIEVLKRERKALLERLKTLKVSAEIRKRILDDINKAIRDAQDDAIRFQKEQQQNIQEALQTRLDLRIQLAEAKGNVKAQVAAHRAKLEELRTELRKLTKQRKGNTIAALELRVAIAEEEKAIKDLKGQTEERNKAQQELFFTFLQTQQGFAANLLGNLIPGFATGGLVGGASAPGGGGGGLPPSAEVGREAQIREGRDRGVSAGQGSTQIQLLRAILHALQALNTRAGHPEARQQRHSMAAMMDIVG